MPFQSERVKQAEPPPPKGVSCAEWDKILQRGPRHASDKELPKSTKKAYYLLGNSSALTALGIMTGERR